MEAAWAPQHQWNHKVLATHGGGCGASYAPAEPPLDDASGTIDADPRPIETSPTSPRSASGFAVMSTALNNTGHNCNVAVEAESMMMARERLVERYGEVRYLIGTGCSGGSIAQHTIANAYPGIYQGLVTTCSYPDVFTAGAQFADYHLMRAYFEDPSTWGLGTVWSPTQMADVEGHLSHRQRGRRRRGALQGARSTPRRLPGATAPVAGDPRRASTPTSTPAASAARSST